MVLAVLLWFKFCIPSVIGDLSGRTARKSIAKMREENEKSGVVNRQRVTFMKPEQSSNPASRDESETGVLAENGTDGADEQQTALLSDNEETALLMDENETVSLKEVVEPPVARSGGKKLKMLNEVMLVHTNEVII